MNFCCCLVDQSVGRLVVCVCLDFVIYYYYYYEDSNRTDGVGGGVMMMMINVCEETDKPPAKQPAPFGLIVQWMAAIASSLACRC